VGWVVVAVAAPAIAFAAVAVGRDAVGSSSVVGALSPAEVSAQLSAASHAAATATAGRVVSPPPGGARPTHTTSQGTRPSSSAAGHGSTSAPTGSPTARPSRSGGVPSPSPTPSPTSAPVSALLTSPGGSVVAQCTGRTVYLVSWSPAQGFSAHSVQRGPGEEAEIEFESDQQSYGVHVHCSGGAPVQSVETGDNGDGPGGGGGDG
jgi:hypothetical protein